MSAPKSYYLPMPLNAFTCEEVVMRILAGALALLAFPAVALAHHGWSSYDPDTVLKITAPIETAA